MQTRCSRERGLYTLLQQEQLHADLHLGPISGHLGCGTGLVSPLRRAETSAPLLRRETRSSWEMPLVAKWCGVAANRQTRPASAVDWPPHTLLTRLIRSLIMAIASIVTLYLSPSPRALVVRPIPHPGSLP